MRRILAAIVAATLMTAGLAVGVAADIHDQGWPTTCVDLNDIVEGHLGNDHNVGIYQRVFGYQAEIACQTDHRSDVRETFAWAFRDSDPPVVDEFGSMGLFGQCRNPSGAYVRIINVTEGLWSCYGIVFHGSVYVGTVKLAESDGIGLSVTLRLNPGTPLLVHGLYFLGGPEYDKIRTFHKEKGTGALSSEYWTW